MNNKFCEYSDKELLETIFFNGKNKQIAFEEIYSRYSSRVYLYCKKFSGEADAGDIFQEVFLKFLKAIENGTKVEKTLSYLLKIARNLNINFRRDRKEIPFDLETFTIPYYDDALESDELAQILDSAIELLSPEFKEAFVLQTFENMSYQEIADLLNVNLSTVRNRIVRAKAKLRTILEPRLEDYRN